MKKDFFNYLVTAAVVILSLSFISGVRAGFDEDFNQASDVNNYQGITNLQSAQLDINIASVIHQENLQIIKSLQEIEERLGKLEASIQKIEQQVVRK